MLDRQRRCACGSPQLGAGQTPGELLNPLVLNTVLRRALQYSLHGDSPLAANLSFALKFLPEAFVPNAPDVLSCLELRYKVSRGCTIGGAGRGRAGRPAGPLSRPSQVDWPLNIVITESCLSRYSGIFSFLLQLKLMMWTLKDICFHLKRTGEGKPAPRSPRRQRRPLLTPALCAALVSPAAGSVQFRQLQLFKHEMQHFVKVTQGYIANQILHVTWCEFRARLAAVGDLEEIQRAHAEYLHKAVFRCVWTAGAKGAGAGLRPGRPPAALPLLPRGLLTEKAAPVMNVIHSVFSLVLKFRSQLISQPWRPAGGPRGAEHPNFALMQQSYNTFKYYSHFLFKGEPSPPLGGLWGRRSGSGEGPA